ncbi:MAG: hypothetical protein KDD43_00870 [Bdellovibrionales bacterium]|nr:hypothetical protein [Bdellovibrionales bacterium]
MEFKCPDCKRMSEAIRKQQKAIEKAKEVIEKAWSVINSNYHVDRTSELYLEYDSAVDEFEILTRLFDPEEDWKNIT